MGKVSSRIGTVGVGGLSAISQQANLGFASITRLIGGFALLGDAFKEAIGFQTEFTKAIAFEDDVTKEQVDSLEALTRSLAIDLGISATDAAKGLKALAQAGLDTNTQIASLSTILKFGVISEENFNAATKQLVDTMNAFHLKTGVAAEDAKTFQRIADVIALGAKKTSVEVGEFSLSIQRVAAPARLLGLSLEETAAVLLEFSKSGFKGQLAATKFQQAILDLSRKSKEIQQAFGVNIFDPDGQLRKLPDIVGEIDAVISKSSDKQRIALLQRAKLIGRNNIGLQVLLGSQKALAQNAEELKNSFGAADNILEIFLKSLERQLGKTRAILNDLAIQFLPPLISGFNLVAQPVLQLTRGFTVLDKAFGGILSKFLQGGAAVATFAALFTQLLPTVVGFAAKGTIAFGNLIANLLLIKPLLGAISTSLTVAGKAMRFFGLIVEEAADVLRDVYDAIFDLAKVIPFLGQVIAGLGKAISRTFFGLAKIAGKVLDVLGIGIENLADSFSKVSPILSGIIGAITGSGFAALFAEIKSTVDELKKIPAVRAALESTAKAFSAAWQAAARLLEIIGKELLRIFEEIGNAILKALGVEPIDAATEGMEGLSEGTRRAAAVFLGFLKIMENVAQTLQAIFEVIAEDLPGFVRLFGLAADAIGERFRAAFAKIGDAFAPVFKELAREFSEMSKSLIEIAKSLKTIADLLIITADGTIRVGRAIKNLPQNAARTLPVPGGPFTNLLPQGFLGDFINFVGIGFSQGLEIGLTKFKRSSTAKSLFDFLFKQQDRTEPPIAPGELERLQRVPRRPSLLSQTGKALGQTADALKELVGIKPAPGQAMDALTEALSNLVDRMIARRQEIQNRLEERLPISAPSPAEFAARRAANIGIMAPSFTNSGFVELANRVQEAINKTAGGTALGVKEAGDNVQKGIFEHVKTTAIESAKTNSLLAAGVGIVSGTRGLG